MIRLIFAITALAAEVPCTSSPEALMRYEKVILSAKTPREIVNPLSCILQMHEHSEGPLRLFAASSLRTLLGGPQIAGVLKDARYGRIAEALAQLTLKSPDPVGQSVIAQFAKGDWRFYQMFCEQGDVSFCADFMPDVASLKRDSPLLAAAGLVRLKNAYKVLTGKPKEEIATRLKRLHKEIPAEDKLRRRFIDEIYRELFEAPSLSPA